MITDDLLTRIRITREEQRKRDRMHFACFAAVLVIIFVIVPMIGAL